MAVIKKIEKKHSKQCRDITKRIVHFAYILDTLGPWGGGGCFRTPRTPPGYGPVSIQDENKDVLFFVNLIYSS